MLLVPLQQEFGIFGYYIQGYYIQSKTGPTQAGGWHEVPPYLSLSSSAATEPCQFKSRRNVLELILRFTESQEHWKPSLENGQGLRECQMINEITCRNCHKPGGRRSEKFQTFWFTFSSFCSRKGTSHCLIWKAVPLSRLSKKGALDYNPIRWRSTKKQNKTPNSFPPPPG